MSKYIVSVEPSESETPSSSSSESDKWNVYYEAAKLEYEYAVTNSAKLDSKAYTLLTVCAFMFAALYTIVGQVKEFFAFVLPKGCYGYPVAIMFFLLLVVAGVYLAKAIFLLIDILDISRTGRADLFTLLQSDIPKSEDYEVTLRRFAVTYSCYVKAGADQREERHKKLAKSIQCIYHSLYAVLVVFVVLLSSFFFQ